MAYRLKNRAGIPYDISTLNGSAILPAYGEITVNLSAFEVEVMHHSPDIEISEADGEVAGIKSLRTEYTELAGKKPFAGWQADRLQAEIDKLLAA